MSGTPYIGSKISLVSKAKIRYEGYLYTIDQNESTVTLAKVKSMGTESRCPNDPVPAREEIFEYIVFRGHDIEDLHVSEAPKKPQPTKQKQMSDPAIAHSGPIQQTQNYPPANQYQNFGPFGGMPSMYPQPYSNRPADPMMNRQHTPPTLPRTPTPEPQKSNNDRPQNQGRSRTDSNRSNERKTSFDKSKNDERNDNQNRYNNRRDNRDSRNYKDNRETEKRERTDRDRRDNRYNPRDNRTKEEHRNDRSDRNEINSTSERRRGSGSRGRGNRGVNRNNNRGTREKFTEDFNFEESNAKFNKEEIEKELLKVLNKVKISDEDDDEEEEFEEKEKNDNAPLPSPDKFYDRSKSFFDNISCEAMGAKPAAPQPKPEETGGVISRRQERALNIETFGSTAGYYRRGGYRGRGGNRGRGRGRGRGNFRGRGSYNRENSSNRNWVDYDFDYEAAGIKSRNPPKASS